MLKEPIERRNFKIPWPCKMGKKENASHTTGRAAFMSLYYDQDMSTWWEYVRSTLHSPLPNNAVTFFFLLSFFHLSCFQSCLFIHYSLFPLKLSETLHFPSKMLFVFLACWSEGQRKVKENIFFSDLSCSPWL